MLLIEGIDTRRPALGNVGMAKQLPHHRPILTFDQGVIVGLAGAGFGAFDQEFAEKASHAPIDVFRAMIGMNPPDGERKRGQQLFQGGNEIRFTDFLYRTHDLKLRDLIDRIDVIHPLLFVPIPLMHGIDAQKARLPGRVRFPAFANA